MVWLCIVTNSLWIEPTHALNSNFISIMTLHVSGSLSVHHQKFLAVGRHWYTLCRFDDHFHPAPGSKLSSDLHKMYQCRCTAKNSWWWAGRLPETCRVVIPIKLELSLSVVFIHKEYCKWINVSENFAVSFFRFDPEEGRCFVFLKCCYPPTRLYCVTTHKTVISVLSFFLS